MKAEAVRPIWGQAFQENCEEIAWQQLGDIWAQEFHPKGALLMSDRIDWEGLHIMRGDVEAVAAALHFVGEGGIGEVASDDFEVLALVD